MQDICGSFCGLLFLAIPFVIALAMIWDNMTHHGFVVCKKYHPPAEGMSQFGDTVFYPAFYELKIIWVRLLWNKTKSIMVDSAFYNQTVIGSRIIYKGGNWDCLPPLRNAQEKS